MLSVLQGQSVYEGSVVDGQGKPVAGAKVWVTATNQQRQETYSDSKGLFRIAFPYEGVVFFSATAEGLSVEEPVRAESTSNKLILKLAPKALRESLTVTAQGLVADIADTGKAIDLLSQEAVESRGEIFLIEALKVVPGLQVQQIGGPGAPARIVTRGLRTADTSILVDGFRFRDITTTQGDAVSLLSDLMIVNPERFEVCRGGESTLYGTNAIGGVVNIVSSQGGGPLRGELAAEGGGLGLLRSQAKFSGGEGKWQWTGALGHLNVRDGVDGRDPFRNTSGQGFLRYILSPKTSLSARMYTNEGFALYNSGPGARSGVTLPAGTIPGTLDFFQPQQNDPDARRATRTLMGMAALDHSFSQNLLLRAQYNRLHSNRSDANGPGGTGFQARFRDFSRFQGDLDTLAARLTYTWGGKQVLLGGYEWERERFFNFGDDGNPNPAQQNVRDVTVTQRSQAIYLQQQFNLGNWLLNAGGRFQDFQLEQPQFSGGRAFFAAGDLSSPPTALTGDISIAYRINKTGTKLRSHVGNSYRAPSMFERFGTSLFFGSYSIFGDPNLKPDRALSMDAGIDQTIWGQRMRASVSYFYTRLQEVVGFGPVPREPYGRTSGYFNTGGGIARGVESSLQAQLNRKLSFTASYTYVNARERRPIFATGELEPQRLSPHTFALTATYFWTKRFDTTVDYIGASSYLTPFFASTGSGFGTRAFRFVGPQKVDLAARYRVLSGEKSGLELFTRLENLANRTYYEAGYQTPGFWGTVGLRWRFL
ncbi:MAG: TonB-dependent receptor [Bryobacter sp.]|nr:TonB-dependent receptor [Bryobacter sp.]